MDIPFDNGPKKPRKRKFKQCYICGREFTTASLPIHLPQCKEKRRNQQALLPEHLRTPLKERSVHEAMKMSHEEASVAHSSNLAECMYCGRTFNPERLAVHNRRCTAEHPSRKLGETPIGGGGGAVKKTPSPQRPSTAPSHRKSRSPMERQREQRAECEYCGKKMPLSRLAFHERQCAYEDDNEEESEDMVATVVLKGRTPPRHVIEAPRHVMEAPMQTVVQQETCGRCQAPFAHASAKFCEMCGVRRPGRKCTGCGERFYCKDAKYCSHCGLDRNRC